MHFIKTRNKGYKNKIQSKNTDKKPKTNST